jgi:AcrR family transcriptional regulator
MSVYNHYGSKSGVIEALFVSGFQRLGAELSSLAEISDPLEALLEGGHRYRRLALDHPAAYRVMFECAVPGFEPSDAAKEVAFAAFSSLVAAVERAMSSGLIADDEPTTVAQMVWATVHGWVSIELSEMSFVEDHDAGAKTLLDTMMRGLRAQG